MNKFAAYTLGTVLPLLAVKNSSAQDTAATAKKAPLTIYCAGSADARKVTGVSFEFDKEKIASDISGRSDSASDILWITTANNAVHLGWKEMITPNNSNPAYIKDFVGNGHMTDAVLKDPLEQIMPSALEACQKNGVNIVKIDTPNRKDLKAFKKIRKHFRPGK